MLLALLPLLLLSPCQADGLPTLSADAQRFPWSAAECKRRYDLADAHCDWLDAHGHRWTFEAQNGFGLGTFVVMTEWRVEAGWRRDCWQWLHESKMPAMSNAKRREVLAELRAVLGPDLYQLGAMPDAAPFWRFRERERGEK